MSFSEPESAAALVREDDLGKLLLLQADLPSMTAGEASFKIGSAEIAEAIAALGTEGVAALIHPVEAPQLLPAERDVLSSAAMQSDPAAPTWRLMRLLDRARFACGIVLECTREFGDFFGEDAYPFYIRDHKLVFDTAAHAKSYFRRAWRFLSENHRPVIDAASAADTTRAALYRKVWPLAVLVR